jgi:protocatechuate 3,4-dioxygenase beta subunit
LIEDLRPDLAHALLVRHPGFGSVVYELPPEERLQSELDLGTIDLAPAASLSGRVVDEEGLPVAGLQLRLSGTNADRGRWSKQRLEDLAFYVERLAARTDDLGRFHFTDLAAGRYQLSGVRQSLDVGTKLDVTLASGEQKTGLELLIAAGMKISGTVVDPDGSPVSGVRVFGFNETTRDLPALQPTDATGAFVLPGLQAGLYRIEFRPPRNWSDPLQKGALFALEIEDVAAGTESLEVRLPWLSSIQGRVLHDDGSPAQAFVSASGAGRWSYYSSATSPDGSFVLWVPEGAILELAAQPRNESGIHVMGGTVPQEVKMPGVSAGTRDLILRLPRVP